MRGGRYVAAQTRPARFQGDAQWQRDFRRLNELYAEMCEHVYACKQLHAAGAHEEARAELVLADEDRDVIACLKHALKYLDDRQCPE
jgi:hypothetical protein